MEFTNQKGFISGLVLGAALLSSCVVKVDLSLTSSQTFWQLRKANLPFLQGAAAAVFSVTLVYFVSFSKLVHPFDILIFLLCLVSLLMLETLNNKLFFFPKQASKYTGMA